MLYFGHKKNKNPWAIIRARLRVYLEMWKKRAALCVGFEFVLLFWFESVCVSRPIFVNWCSMRLTLMRAEKWFNVTTPLLLLLLSSILSLLPSSVVSHATHWKPHTETSNSDGLTKNRKKRKYFVCVMIFFFSTRLGRTRTDENSSFVHRMLCILWNDRHSVSKNCCETETKICICICFNMKTRTHSFYVRRHIWNVETEEMSKQTQPNVYTCDV